MFLLSLETVSVTQLLVMDIVAARVFCAMHIFVLNLNFTYELSKIVFII